MMGKNLLTLLKEILTLTLLKKKRKLKKNKKKLMIVYVIKLKNVLVVELKKLLFLKELLIHLVLFLLEKKDGVLIWLVL